MVLKQKKIRLEDVTNDHKRIRESLVNNYAEWGPPLQLDDYLSREKQLHDMHIQNGFDHRTFVLIDEANNGVLAACEVLSRPLYKGGGTMAKDHCVASVFVCPEYRKQGNCQMLIEQVVQLYTKDSPEDQMSLWSDVGDYYSRAGFNFPASFRGEPQWNRTLVCSQAAGQDSACEFLGAEDTLAQIVPEHQRLLRRDVDSLYRDCQGDIDVAIVLPHVGLYEQLQFRAQFTASKLGMKVPDKFAARSPDGHGWISWTYMLSSKKLLVLGLFGSANEMAILLAAAMEAAAEYDCKVEMYESSIVEPLSDIDELIAATDSIRLSVHLEERTKSLPMSIGADIWVCHGGYGWY